MRSNGGEVERFGIEDVSRDALYVTFSDHLNQGLTLVEIPSHLDERIYMPLQ